jgi:hypothetical protein
MQIVAAAREGTHQQSTTAPYVVFDCGDRTVWIVTNGLSTLGLVLLEEVAAVDVIVLHLHLEIVMDVG